MTEKGGCPPDFEKEGAEASPADQARVRSSLTDNDQLLSRLAALGRDKALWIIEATEVQLRVNPSLEGARAVLELGIAEAEGHRRNLKLAERIIEMRSARSGQEGGLKQKVPDEELFTAARRVRARAGDRELVGQAFFRCVMAELEGPAGEQRLQWDTIGRRLRGRPDDTTIWGKYPPRKKASAR